ncbi:hypothetical protein [Luteimonas sp. MHLX1A]|uniref:hypothetical protein n=1 Tax=Alterluteimonas muca TaxID=2878684 RepID=UPI001E3992C9|nr:hypothetical protein [Luteimonas sp. MHLX1A]MCD9047357.1 hypothetical protein [Luteimonas sp. MHLX1A]
MNAPAPALPQSTNACFPFVVHWNPHQLADAVPQRLHRLDLLAGIAGAAHRPRVLRQGTRRYAPAPLASTDFRIHG